MLIAISGNGSNDTMESADPPTSQQVVSEESLENAEELSGDVEETTATIEGLAFTKDDEVTVKVGKSVSPGYLEVSVTSRENFSADDVIFVSENSEVATICLSKDSGTMLYFEITGVNGGETDVYAISEDGSVKSEAIHVVVPEPIEVDSIELGDIETDLVIGESVNVKTTISPSDAEDKTLLWTSNDETVATVDEEGTVRAVGGGTATITVSASNDVEASFEINVDGSKMLVNVKTSHSRGDDNNIGHEWSYDIEINGETAPRTMGIAVGDTISFSAKITEADDNPDIGTGSASHTVTEEDLINGFEVSFDVYVTENGGRYRGKSAHFIVSYTFSPN